jgi:hypothetical protein
MVNMLDRLCDLHQQLTVVRNAIHVYVPATGEPQPRVEPLEIGSNVFFLAVHTLVSANGRVMTSTAP